MCLRFQSTRNITWPDERPVVPDDNVFETCRPGQYKNADSNNKCDKCPPGLFQPEDNSLVPQCSKCKTLGDWYSDLYGASTCTKCPANTQRKQREEGESEEADNVKVCECQASEIAHPPNLAPEARWRRACAFWGCSCEQATTAPMDNGAR